MDRFLEVSRNLLILVGRAEMAFACLVLTAIVVMILVQVALNAGLGSPFAWEQEGGAYALVWLTFVGASIGLKQLRHVRIVSFVSMLPPRWQAFMRMIAFAIILWLLYLIMVELTAIIPIEGRANTVALPIDVPRSWFFSVPLFVSCALMAWTSVQFFLEQLMRFLDPTRNVPPALMRTEDQITEV